MPFLPQMQESYYIALIIIGLKEEIKNMVKLVNSLTLLKTIQAAKSQEKTIEAIKNLETQQHTPPIPYSEIPNQKNHLPMNYNPP